MNERDIAVARAVLQCPNGVGNATQISWKMGYKGNSGRMAVTSTLRSMERRGLVGRIPPRDQWAHANWCLLTEAKQTLATLEAAP